MNKWWQRYYKMDEAGDGTEGGAGGGSGSEGGEEGGAEGSEGSDDGKGEGDDGKKPGISDAEAKLLRENMKRKEEAEKLKKQLAQANETLKQFEGIDPTAVRDLLKKQKDEELAQLEKKGQWDVLRESMAKEHQTEKSTLTSQIEALQNDLKKSLSTINELTIGSQFSNSPFIKEKLLMTPNKAKVIYGSHFDFVDGEVVAYDKPRGADNRSPLVNGSGDPLSFDLAMQKLIDADPEKDSLLRPTIKPGANSNSENPRKLDASKDKEQASSLDKITEGLKGLKQPMISVKVSHS